MQWSFDVDFLPALRPTFYDFEVSCHSSSLVIIHGSSALIADPGMGSSTARVDPHDVLEAKVVSQGCIYDFDSHSDKRPTFVADVGFVAAGSDLVIVCQIDIEDKLFGHGPEGS